MTGVLRRMRVRVSQLPAMAGPRDHEYWLEVEHPRFDDMWLPLWPIKSVSL